MNYLRQLTSQRRVPLGIIGLLGLIAISLALYFRTAWWADSSVSQQIVTLAFAGVEHNNEWEPVLRNQIHSLMLALVPAGCFMMGSTPAQLEPAQDSCDRFYGDTVGCQVNFAASERPVHKVCFPKPYWIGATEITNRQYGSSSSQSAEMYRGSDWPRDTVTWAQALAFCQQAGLRLPTEAEWEYAARGPDSLIYPWGNSFEPTYLVSGVLAPANVGQLPAGRSWVGAYDLSGSMLEWTSDWYASYSAQEQVNPQGPAQGDQRVARGGSWFSFAAFQVRAAQRYPQDPRFATSIIGFRCAGDFGS